MKLVQVRHSSLNCCSPCCKIRCTMPLVLLQQPDPTTWLTIEKIDLSTVFELISDLLLMSDFWWDSRWGSTNYDDRCQDFNLAQKWRTGAHERCALHSCDALQYLFKFEKWRKENLNQNAHVQGKPKNFTDFKLVLDNRVYRLDGGWRDLFQRMKWDVIKSALKSVLNLQGRKFRVLSRHHPFIILSFPKIASNLFTYRTSGCLICSLTELVAVCLSLLTAIETIFISSAFHCAIL